MSEAPRPERVPFDLTDAETAVARAAVERRLCDHCLGRLWGSRGRGYSNRVRGEIVRARLGVAREVSPADCSLCAGLFSRLDLFASLAVAKTKEWEHATYLVGTKVETETERAEEALWSSLSLPGEAIGKELNREIGKRYGEAEGRKVDLKYPEVSILVDTRFDSVGVAVNPLHVYGRYRKLARDIPQTRWPCQKCLGRGGKCDRCGGSGKMYPMSVEEIIGAPLLSASGGERHKLHAMGREDIDARMLGRGRPFVIEIARPRRRGLDLAAVREEINRSASGRVEVAGLRRSSVPEVEEVTQARPEKSYQAGIRAEDGLDGLEEALRRLVAGGIDQRTPVRVSHRRADMVRKKSVVSAEVVRRSADSREAVINIRASAGAYIKELVHGDQGRTSPSLAGLLARPVEVRWLDVLDVHDE